MTATKAIGVEGCLIRGINGEYYFRVYDADHNFVDYDLMHSDLSITITDADAYFYREPGRDVLDHAPATLGIES